MPHRLQTIHQEQGSPMVRLPGPVKALREPALATRAQKVQRVSVQIRSFFLLHMCLHQQSLQNVKGRFHSQLQILPLRNPVRRV